MSPGADNPYRAPPPLGRLQALGVGSWAGLVFYLPRRYKDYSEVLTTFAAARERSREAKTVCLVVVATADGFRLAELDLRSRGFGDPAEDSELQTGASPTIFAGLALTPSDLEEANRMLERLRAG